MFNRFVLLCSIPVLLSGFLSELSDPDREFLLSGAMLRFSERIVSDPYLIFCPFSFTSNMTFEMILNEISESLSENIKIKGLISSKVNSRFLQLMKKENPLEYIIEILSSYSSAIHANEETFSSKSSSSANSSSSSTTTPRVKKLQFILYFPFYEKISSSNSRLLSLLFEKLSFTSFSSSNSSSSSSASSIWNLLIFACQSSISNALQPLSQPSLHFSVNYHQFSLCSPSALLNAVIKECFIKSNLPLFLPHNLFEILLKEYYDFTMCSSTFIQRFVSTLMLFLFVFTFPFFFLFLFPFDGFQSISFYSKSF
jgi:hypothetical protein